MTPTDPTPDTYSAEETKQLLAHYEEWQYVPGHPTTKTQADILAAQLAKCEKARAELERQITKGRKALLGDDYGHLSLIDAITIFRLDQDALHAAESKARRRAEEERAEEERAEEELVELRRQVNDWNEAVAKIIGRVPNTGINATHLQPEEKT